MECRKTVSSKKVWQPPSQQKQPVSAASNSQSRTTNSCNNSKKSFTTISRESSHSAAKPGSNSTSDTLTSALTSKNKRGRNGERANKDSASAEQSNSLESENYETVNKDSYKATAAVEIRPPSSVPPAAADASSDTAASGLTSSGNRRLSDVNEPTKQPVAARLAAWKKKTSAAENTSTSSQRPASRDRLHTISETGGMHRQVSSGKVSNTDTACPCTVDSTGKASDSVAVTAGSSDDSGKRSFPPLKEGEVRQRTFPCRLPQTKRGAVQPSYRKLGPATFEIQQKLSAICENWKRNEIAEKSRKERAEDLAVVENRWRNGILADEQKDAVPSATCLSSSESEITSRCQVSSHNTICRFLMLKSTSSLFTNMYCLF